MTEPAHTGPYFVVFMTTKFRSLAEAAERAPSAMSAHLASSQLLHAEGSLLMAGAFLDQPDQPVRTMAVFRTHGAAEDHVRRDPFVEGGWVDEWVMREWGSVLG